MKTTTKSKKAYYALIPLGLALVLLLLYYESVLIEAGRFLAPEGNQGLSVPGNGNSVLRV
jgi:hypothetical protein